MTRLRHGLLALTLLLFAAAPAQAAIIDFTDADVWGDADGLFSSFNVYDGVTVTVTAAFAGQTLTFNDEGIGFNIGCAILTGGALACDGDGLGIGDDEVGFGYPTAGSEALFVHFSQPVDIGRFAVLDLYGRGGSDPNAEVAQWGALFTTAPFFASGTVTGTDPSYLLGLVVGNINLTNVTSLVFHGAGPSNSDFSVAAIEMTPTIPEPATLLLTGAGLALVARRARRRRA